MNKTIAVLLTCHNRREKTIACLQSLYKCILPENYTIEVFLVDDDSSDGTSEAVKNEFPQVNVIQGLGNLYWNRGMHLAWETAIRTKFFDFYFWLNDDTLLFENALKLMLDYSQTIDNKKIIVGATCSLKNQTITYSGFNLPFQKIVPNGIWQACRYFNGNIVLIPSFVYQKVGLLDKRYRHALGDFDYGMRASRIGFVHALAPQFLGTCDEHESDPDWRNLSIPLYKRVKHLYSPLGNHPFEFFIFEKNNNGFWLAIVRFISVHLRLLFPKMWKRKY